MASSRVMASSSSANSDLTRQSTSIYPLSTADPSKSRRSVIMEDLIRNMYGDNAAASAASAVSYCGESDGGEGAPTMSKIMGSKSVDEVWKEISGGGGEGKVDVGDGSAFNGEITLEEFLSKEEIRVPAGFEVDPVMSDRFDQQQQPQAPLSMENPVLEFGNGAESGAGGGGRGRGRKRLALDPVDRAVLQRQKRMIKNRESAARSRERKQAYTLELEALVTRLEGEKAEILKEIEETERERLKQESNKVWAQMDACFSCWLRIDTPMSLGRIVIRIKMEFLYIHLPISLKMQGF